MKKIALLALLVVATGIFFTSRIIQTRLNTHITSLEVERGKTLEESGERLIQILQPTQPQSIEEEEGRIFTATLIANTYKLKDLEATDDPIGTAVKRLVDLSKQEQQLIKKIQRESQAKTPRALWYTYTDIQTLKYVLYQHRGYNTFLMALYDPAFSKSK